MYSPPVSAHFGFLPFNSLYFLTLSCVFLAFSYHHMLPRSPFDATFLLLLPSVISLPASCGSLINLYHSLVNCVTFTSCCLGSLLRQVEMKCTFTRTDSASPFLLRCLLSPLVSLPDTRSFTAGIPERKQYSSQTSRGL